MCLVWRRGPSSWRTSLRRAQSVCTAQTPCSRTCSVSYTTFLSFFPSQANHFRSSTLDSSSDKKSQPSLLREMQWRSVHPASLHKYSAVSTCTKLTSVVQPAGSCTVSPCINLQYICPTSCSYELLDECFSCRVWDLNTLSSVDAAYRTSLLLYQLKVKKIKKALKVYSEVY